MSAQFLFSVMLRIFGESPFDMHIFTINSLGQKKIDDRLVNTNLNLYKLYQTFFYSTGSLAKSRSLHQLRCKACS